jgi:putative heme-binding domain-containing protein
LLDAMEAKIVPQQDVSPFHARQLAALKNREIDKRLAEVWGRAQPVAQDKQRLKEMIASTLPDEVIAQADVRGGRAVFARMCGACHSLFGEGAKIGPDLTGAQRANLDYLLENLIDPNALVGKNYQMTLVTLDDGRVLSGVIEAESDAMVTLKTTSGGTMLSRSEIEELRTSPISMMPEGQLEKLSFEELRDLVAYLRSPRQVPLP